MIGLIKLMRPKQWVKNAFVFAPLLFSGEFDTLSSIYLSTIACFIFCLASSSVYVLNDYKDIDADRKHHVKRYTRPLASGEVSKTQAIVLLLSIYVMISLVFCYFPKLILGIVGYIILNVAYTFYLKEKPVVDIFTIATGFVLRVYSGTVIIDVPLSSWMFITTLSLALYLAAIKRRQELLSSGASSRGVLKYYTVTLVDKYAEMSATCAILFYSLFVITVKSEMVITIPFVLFGLYRYWYIVEVRDSGESPTDALFSDKPLQVCILFWVLSCGYFL
ncbi:decaprenyl-phosphate phosphoribosyltransferase [Vibrio sp. 10N.286.52.C3]|uniref:decaprenyl-phosphate phosphoribosyltransferase n=1 Tax=Vibrio sp. 10N.286.52.C3 TaxID=3229713 RepID=UPI003552FCDE